MICQLVLQQLFSITLHLSGYFVLSIN